MTTEPSALEVPDRDTAARLLGRMLLIRRFEERCVELYSASRIRGFLHLYIGEEAVAAGVIDVLAMTRPSSRRTASTVTPSCAGSIRTG